MFDKERAPPPPRKRSVVRIVNNDNMCLARAIIVAIAKADDDPKYKTVTDIRYKLQGVRARLLLVSAGLGCNREVSLNDVYRLEEASQRQVVIFSSTRVNKPLYVGQQQDKRIYLYHTVLDDGTGHYDVITSITGCLGVKYFCHRCL